MSARRCKHYEYCDAPLCPIDPKSLENGVWYADEEICRARGYQGLRWIRVQKRIARLHQKHPVRGYFTVEMLNQIDRVKPGLHGLDPDKPVDKEFRAWMRAFTRGRTKVIRKQGSASSENGCVRRG